MTDIGREGKFEKAKKYMWKEIYNGVWNYTRNKGHIPTFSIFIQTWKTLKPNYELLQTVKNPFKLLIWQAQNERVTEYLRMW